MCKTKDCMGIMLAVFVSALSCPKLTQTVLLLVYGNAICNYYCLFQWHKEPNPDNQLILGRNKV